KERAERLGVQAASEKRIGGLQHPYDEKEETASYARARDLYEEALFTWPMNTWVATQFLSMTAVLAVKDPEELAKTSDRFKSWWAASQQVASWDLRTACGEDRAWALGTLAELELLGVVYAGATFVRANALATIARQCSELCEAVGRNAFAVHSTRRQF